jgi:isopentenyl-diphosphate Delta-isomerase
MIIMADELIDIYNENNKFLRKKLKSKAHREGLWHRSAQIWIYNKKGQLLVQLRAKDKALFPDTWDISVAGHVSSGEEPINTAIKEIKEEIELNIKKTDLEFVKIRKNSMKYKDLVNNEHGYVYLLDYEGNIKDLRLQKEEVQEIRFLDIDQVEKELINSQRKYVPLGKYWDEMIAEIRKRLSK